LTFRLTFHGMPACGVAAATSAFLFGGGRMLVIEHLQGKQDYELRLLLGRRKLETLLDWLHRREEEAAAAYREVAVTLQSGQARALMWPAGPRGGRLPR